MLVDSNAETLISAKLTLNDAVISVPATFIAVSDKFISELFKPKLNPVAVENCVPSDPFWTRIIYSTRHYTFTKPYSNPPLIEGSPINAASKVVLLTTRHLKLNLPEDNVDVCKSVISTTEPASSLVVLNYKI